MVKGVDHTDWNKKVVGDHGDSGSLQRASITPRRHLHGAQSADTLYLRAIIYPLPEHVVSSGFMGRTANDMVAQRCEQLSGEFGARPFMDLRIRELHY